MPSPAKSSAFASAAPLCGALPVVGLERAACPRRNAGARRSRSGARACALPIGNSDDARAAGKARAAAILARELPRLLSRRGSNGNAGGGARELVGGGAGELFAQNVEFDFPVSGAGSGRRMLKMLLMSLPLQANFGMLYPMVEDLVIASPSPDCLDLNYNVRSSSLPDEAMDSGWGRRVGSVFGDFTKAELGPRVSVVHVRTRLRFDEEGRIAKWVDTWNKSVPEVLEDLANLSDPPAVLSSNSKETESGSDSGVTQLHSRVASSLERNDARKGVDSNEASVESAFREDDWLYEGAEEDHFVGNGWRPSDGDDGAAAGRRLADAIVPSGPPLLPADARAAALRVAEYLRDDFPRFSLPGGGAASGRNPLDLSQYNLFHSDAILETPAFVSEGAESLALLHAVARADTWLRFTNARIVCTEARVEAPRVVVARYIMRARGRLAGGLVQKSSFVKLRLNAAGEIIHCELSVDSIKDDCLPLFGRTKRWLWLG